ncbi:GNAT family N-acetyltransferase [Agromyces seonyuensis]|uniref:GNAT family N-acetyltransferase n=1 Tax=Agromyces seonyuensis TaxID=2662446 RepID=A0A6I4NZ17_9MICO|nr:GNAT family N-acetyltransferase [Agromyces seonyuensis]MWB99391.1 GNAT family N-acetyltransferase [Agromyces seonyuensis]
MTSHAPADPVSTATLAAKGLRYELVDTADRAAHGRWIDADLRGFHRARPEEAKREALLDAHGADRTIGVYDDTIIDPATPIATVSGWTSELTMSPDRTLPAWAISSVTVSPTHRRRGVARAMLEGELRAAHAAGFPLAMLTVTEATIYGRYGFAPAAQASTITVDRAAARWNGPEAPGRIHFVEPGDADATLRDVTTRATRRTPGEAARAEADHRHLFGRIEPAGEEARATRVARYDDAQGRPRGFVVYRVVRTPPKRGSVEVDRFVAVDDESERALWRFLVEQDFVERIVVPLRSIDDPLPWLLADPRAVSFASHVDHLWVRVLDAPRALSSRRYSAAGALVLDVEDPAGFVDGAVRLETDATGDATVERLGDAMVIGDAPRLVLGAPELASILLGGVRASVLAAAGRIDGSPEALALADRMFAAERTPLLSFWF